MTDENKKAIADAFRDTVRAQVKEGGNTRWGERESTAVIEALADTAYGLEEGFDGIRDLVRRVVNPSAFAQFLESQPKTHPAHIRRPGRGKRNATAVEV